MNWHVFYSKRKRSAMLNGTQNVFDSRRKLKMTKTVLDAPDNKLTAKQRQALAVNQCLFLGLTSQVQHPLTILKDTRVESLLDCSLLLMSKHDLYHHST